LIKDNGGDAVETFLCQVYLLLENISRPGSWGGHCSWMPLAGIEWDWMVYKAKMPCGVGLPIMGRFKLEGYNECLIAMFLAAASPTHPISAMASTDGREVESCRKLVRFLVFNHNGAAGNVGPLVDCPI
jgi:hypothetical protein